MKEHGPATGANEPGDRCPSSMRAQTISSLAVAHLVLVAASIELWPAFTERAFEGYRSYYDFVPKGTFEVEYTIRLNQAGTFQLPATRVEALYEAEMFGESPNAPFEVAY